MRDCTGRSTGLTRRQAFTAVGLTALGAGLFRADRARAGQTDILLLTCMDYRLTDEIHAYMASRGLKDRYDHVVLAGAALGATTDRFPAWNETFFAHLQVAIDLHHVHKVVVLDHDDCGAYRVIMGDGMADPAVAEGAHVERLRVLQTRIQARHPALEVELGIMGLDGRVRPVACAGLCVPARAEAAPAAAHAAPAPAPQATAPRPAPAAPARNRVSAH